MDQWGRAQRARHFWGGNRFEPKVAGRGGRRVKRRSDGACQHRRHGESQQRRSGGSARWRSLAGEFPVSMTRMLAIGVTSGPNRASSQGAALLIMLLVIVMTFSASLITSLAGQNVEATRQEKTSGALVQAKQSLIAWSVLQGDLGAGADARPGTLPCPDTNFFGSSLSGYAAGSCSAAGGTSIGRLPWKTLGIEMLRDANGYPLWYAVSDNFRRPGLTNAAINSDSKGTLQIYAQDGTSLLTPNGEELAAVIFSPGAPLPGQDRIAAPNAAASYLDTGGGRNNGSASGPFIQGPVKNVQGETIVNDQLLGISAKELIAALERRALKAAQVALGTYAAAHSGKLPNPGGSTGTNCTSTITNVTTYNSSTDACTSDNSTCFGRLPEDALAPYVANWFQRNGWGRVMTYAVNKNVVQDPSSPTCSTALKVDGQPKNYVIVAPGTAQGTALRPSTSLADYLEDPANADAWAGDADFQTPSTGSNDQLLRSP